MSDTKTCVVVGASHAGSQLAVQVRKLGWQGRIVLISEEAALPYHRPPLSKAVLAGEKEVTDILLRPAAMYQNSDIELRLSTRVTRIHRNTRTVRLENGEDINYDKLALCTGAGVIKLPLGDGLGGVHYLRTITDINAIRDHLGSGQRVVVIGAGYIGLEAAAVLSKLGLRVTVLERAERVLVRVTGPEISSYITALHRHHGVEIVCGADVVSINGEQRVDSVSCANGDTRSADLVLVGVGIVPETGLAQHAGLRVENGICVDEFSCTSDPDIYAAGDCTSHLNAVYGRRIRLESVQNANDQSRVAAANICGKTMRYDMVPWFWSDQFDIKLQSAGLFAGYDDTVLLGEASVDNADGFSLLYFREDQLIAADCVNQAKVFMATRKLIQDQADRQTCLAILSSLAS